MSKQQIKYKTTGLIKQSQLKKSKISWLYLLAVLVISTLIFYPSVNYEFVNWDDDINVTENQNVQHLTGKNVKNIFTSTVIGGYTPLTSLTFAVEYHFFGKNPKPFHVTNLILHLISTTLFFFLLRLLGMNLFISFTAALLFGIHPMRIESVAWITERKDVLYTVFYFLSAVLYINFKKSRNQLYYILSFISFFFSCLAKIQAVSLPLSLVLIDYFMEKKFNLKQINNKIPFFILSLITGLAGIYFLKQEGNLETKTIIPFVQRFFIGTYSLCVYVVKAFIPYENSAIYPFPSHLSFQHFLSMPVVLAAGFFIWKIRKFRTEIIFGMLWFFFNVVFMLQVVGAGQGYIADRFTYVPYAGLFFVFAFLTDHLASGKGRIPVISAGVLYLLLLGVVTHDKLKIWQNSETLFSNVIDKYPTVAVAYNNMGRYYREKKLYDKAISFYNKAIEIDPKGYKTYSNRGKAYFDLRRNDEALADFNKSIEIFGEYAEARSNRGAVLAFKGDYSGALTDLNKAIELQPGNSVALSNRALVWYSMHEFQKAAGDVTTYLKMKPDDSDMINLRALSYSQSGMLKEALADYNRAIELQPGQGIFWQNRSFYFNKTGDKASALRDIRKAQELGVKVNPDYLKSLE